MVNDDVLRQIEFIKEQRKNKAWHCSTSVLQCCVIIWM
jgi:hypothetical protein